MELAREPDPAGQRRRQPDPDGGGAARTRSAVVDGDRSWTYAEFNAWVNRVAHGLAGRGYEPGDALGAGVGQQRRVPGRLLRLRQARRGLRADQPGLAAGRGRLRARPLRARGLVVETQLVGAMTEAVGEGARDRRRHRRARARRASTRPSRPSGAGPRRGPARGRRRERAARCWSRTALRSATSTPRGTTSFPKGVVGSHLAHLPGVDVRRRWTAAGPTSDRFVAMMPMFHTAQLNAFCTPAVLVGATIHVLRGFDPASSSTRSRGKQITQVFGLPMMYRAALEHPIFGERDVTSLRRAVYAMAPMPDALIRALPRGVRLRLRAAVRADGDEPGDHAVPPRAPAVAHRCGRHPDHRRPGRDHGAGRDAAAAG